MPVPLAVGISDEHRWKLLRIARKLGSPYLYTDSRTLARLEDFRDAFRHRFDASLGRDPAHANPVVVPSKDWGGLGSVRLQSTYHCLGRIVGSVFEITTAIDALEDLLVRNIQKNDSIELTAEL